MTRSIRTRLRRAIGLGLALGVVIAPNALAKPYIGDFSAGTAPSTSKTLPGSNPAANPYSIYRPAVANQTVVKSTTANGYSFYRPAVAPASVTAGTIAVTHDSWGRDLRSAAVNTPSAVTPTSGSHETRDVLLAASGIGLLLIGAGSLVLMLRRRRAQLA